MNLTGFEEVQRSALHTREWASLVLARQANALELQFTTTDEVVDKCLYGIKA